MRTLRDFANYLKALWREGKALVMGGSVFALIAIYGLATNKSVPVNIGYAVLGVTFVLAGFSAWRKESQEKTRLQGDLDSFQKHLDSQGIYQRPGMVFVDETPAFLTQFFKQHASIQAKKLVQPYLGKWIKLSNVTVSDIEAQSQRYRVPAHCADGEMVFMYFDEKWFERVSILRRGSQIAIIGRITSLENFLTLDNCEIL